MADNFSQRLNAVFGGLDSKLKSSVDCPLKEDWQPETHVAESVPRSQGTYRWQRSRESKRSISRRSQTTPDYIRNPHKWKKYDLTDDGSKDLEERLTDDQVNRRTALSFIADLRERKETEHLADYHQHSQTSINPDQIKITFRNPKHAGKKSGDSQSEQEARGEVGSGPQLTSRKAVKGLSSTTQSSGLFRMPEYVVGGKRKRTVKEAGSSSADSCNSSNKTKKGMITLSHLNDDEDDS